MAAIQTVIFCGPSLYGVTVRRMPHELWRPPARQGDICHHLLAYSRVRQIVLIDGVFHQSQSVFHKELGYALLRGVACIGAASMGALRAAEMHRYGMIGIGKIFERYRDGEEDDSLVAMTFDSETYKPLEIAAVGQDQKARDALDAIQFARSYRGSVKTSLTLQSISPFYERCIMQEAEKIYG